MVCVRVNLSPLFLKKKCTRDERFFHYSLCQSVDFEGVFIYFCCV